MSEIPLPFDPRRDNPETGYLVVQQNVDALASLFTTGSISGGVPIWDEESGKFITDNAFKRGPDLVISAANTDLSWVNGAALSSFNEVTTVGGTLRNLGAPDGGIGTRYIIRHGTGSGTFTIKHLSAGTGAQFFLNGGADIVMGVSDVMEFVYDGTYWVQINLDRASGLGNVGYTTTAYRNTNQSLTNAIWNQITLVDGEWRDDGGWHSTSTNPARITMPVGGVYLVSTYVEPNGMTGSGPCELRITSYDSGGGAVHLNVAYASDLNNLNSRLSCSGIYPLGSAGHYFTTEFQGNATGAGGNIGLCIMSATLLKTP